MPQPQPRHRPLARQPSWPAGVLGAQVAGIAGLAGVDRDINNLAITPRVRELVTGPHMRGVADDFRTRTSHPGRTGGWGVMARR